MFQFSAKLLMKKKAWGSPDDLRVQRQDDRLREKQQKADPNDPHHGEAFKKHKNLEQAQAFFQEFQQYAQDVFTKYKIKHTSLSQWLQAYAFDDLLKKPDPVVRDGAKDFLNKIKTYGIQGIEKLEDPSNPSISAAAMFKKTYGSNIYDWLGNLGIPTGGKKISLLVKKKNAEKARKNDWTVGPYSNQHSDKNNDAEDDMDPDTTPRSTSESHDSR